MQSGISAEQVLQSLGTMDRGVIPDDDEETTQMAQQMPQQMPQEVLHLIAREIKPAWGRKYGP